MIGHFDLLFCIITPSGQALAGRASRTVYSGPRKTIICLSEKRFIMLTKTILHTTLATGIFAVALSSAPASAEGTEIINCRCLDFNNKNTRSIAEAACNKDAASHGYKVAVIRPKKSSDKGGADYCPACENSSDEQVLCLGK